MPSSPLGRYRVALATLVIAMTISKLLVAARTIGTDDVRTWTDFAAGIAEAGPVGIYRLHFDSLYNHPPLIGYMLQAVNAATRHGIAFPLAIRIPAISADVVTPFLMLELLRRRRPLHTSYVAAASVAVSPALFGISGFHGNTDPVVIMLSLLSVYLLVDRRAPALAGLSLAIALGVKIVPVVIVPALVAFAAQTGWRYGLRFGLAAGTLFVLIWAPAALRMWQPIVDNVLGYAGGRQPWGLVQLGKWIGNPGWVAWLEDPGRFLIMFFVAGLPAGLVLWRARYVVEASALALTGLLALSPAFGIQYLAWAVAPAYLLSFRRATAFNLIASCLLIEVYTRWNGGFPWYLATSSWFTRGEVIVGFALWATLLSVVVAGTQRCVRSQRPPLQDVSSHA